MKKAVFAPAFAALFVAMAMTASFIQTSPPALAASKSGEEARTIPTGVFELLVGGSWEQKKKSGYYRAIALAAGKSGKEYAEVWLQWIEVGKTNAKVMKNIPIKEITALQLPSLSLAMDIEESGNAIVVITQYDEETGEPSVFEYRASQPGIYQALEAQVAADQGAEEPTTETK